VFVDTHCHLDFDIYSSDLQEVFSRANKSRVDLFINPAVNLVSSTQCMSLAENYINVYSAIGVHPNEINDLSDAEIIASLSFFIGHEKLVAIGEIGLDYYHNLFDHETQKKTFLIQLNLALTNHLPVIVHSREAISDVLDIISGCYSKHAPNDLYPNSGVLHAFEGDVEDALRAIEYGFYIGIGGPVTYKNSFQKQNVVKKIPLRSILLETDSPFLSPEPLRGRRNEPANIKIIAEIISKLKECDIKQVENQTTKNACSLFKIGEEIDLN
jgi:TatD DNase family protein